MRSIPPSPAMPFSPRLPRMVPHTSHGKHRKDHSRVYRTPRPLYKRPSVLLAAALAVYLIYRWLPSSSNPPASTAVAGKGKGVSVSNKAGPRSQRVSPHGDELAEEEGAHIDARAKYHAERQAALRAVEHDKTHGKQAAGAHDGRGNRKAGGGGAVGGVPDHPRRHPSPEHRDQPRVEEKKTSGAEVFEYVQGYVHYPHIGDASRGGREQGSVRHPISWLIEQAEHKWARILSRQSRTLDQAVAEYRRRYGRRPPRGFDLWWHFARENDVVLVDEYDQIDADITPFLAMPAPIVLNRSETIVHHKGYMPAQSVFVVEIAAGEAALLPGPNTETSRAADVLANMQKIARWLPDIRIPFTIEDGPGVVISGEEKMMHAAIAKQGRKMTQQELENVPSMVDLTLPLWESACAPGSEMRKAFTGEGAGQSVPVGASSFIGLEHMKAIDLCAHPEHRLQHGQTLVEGNSRGELFPLISSSKTALHSDILTTPMEQFYTPTGADPAWHAKQHERVLWRGSTTGGWHHRGAFWRSAHRPRLVTMTNSRAGKRELTYASHDEGDLMRTKVVPEAEANARLFDVAYAGLPLQCTYAPGADETCVYMKNQLRFEPHMGTDEANTYKYVLDVDGNAWSGRFHRLMSTSSCVFKSTIYPEWWTTRAVPWYHYVPIKVDYSDLHNAAAYFIGVDGVGAHDDAGRKIGQQGKEWAEKHWREEDMLAYQLRLFLELARAFYGDGEGSYDYKG